MSWTAPGDDSLTGQASVYDLRYSLLPIVNLAFFNAAARAQGMPPPSPSGTPESFTVSGLLTNIPYYFAIRTADSHGNWSGLSNVVSKVATPVVDAAPGTPTVLDFSRPRPNPASDGATFAVSLPAPAEVEVSIFDVLGRRIRTLASGRWPAGRTTLRWDLRDDHGIRMAAGSYRARARLDGATFVHVVVVTH